MGRIKWRSLDDCRYRSKTLKEKLLKNLVLVRDFERSDADLRNAPLFSSKILSLLCVCIKGRLSKSVLSNVPSVPYVPNVPKTLTCQRALRAQNIDVPSKSRKRRFHDANEY